MCNFIKLNTLERGDIIYINMDNVTEIRNKIINKKIVGSHIWILNEIKQSVTVKERAIEIMEMI